VLRGEFSPATEVRQRNRVYDEAVAVMSMASIKTNLADSSKRGLAGIFVHCFITDKKNDRKNRFVQSSGGAPAASG